MTLDEWEAKYYPIDADAFRGRDVNDLHTQIEATKHSLQKWIGLRDENRKDVVIFDIEVSSRTCALCQLTALSDDGCDQCPLFKARDGFSCDEVTDNEALSPFHAFSDPHRNKGVNRGVRNPEPMIRELECTLEMLEKELKDEQSKYSSETK